MARRCDSCGIRPASVRVAATVNGKSGVVELCDVCYGRARQQGGYPVSPLESLFRGSSFDRLVDSFHAADGQRDGAARQGVDRGGPQQSVDLDSVLSDQAREMLQGAAQKAVEYGHRYVDTEHILYALLGGQIVDRILKQFKISSEDLREYIEHNAPRGERALDDTEELSVTPRVKSALEHAFHASREMGHSYIGPEHILIGLAEEREGMAGDILAKYGLTSNALRQKTLKTVGRGAESGRVEPSASMPNLEKYSRDLTKLATEGRLDPVIGRSKEIETTVEILARRKKNNPVLIGEPGVGKTAIVEGLAQRIAHDEVPEALAGKRLVELNVNALVAGAKYRGEFEERVKLVLDEIVANQDAIILFIDELHTITGAGQGGGEGGLDIANVFKPALARGELHLIGATTLNEYQKHIEKDAALERRFQPVFVSEPTVEQTISILRGLRDRYEAHHKIRITDEAIIAATELSDRYVSNRYLPDKAIDLLDQAAARVRIQSTSRPPELHELDVVIRQTNRELDYAKSRKEYDKAKELEAKIAEKEGERDEGEAAWRKRAGTDTAEVRLSHIAEIVSTLSGIPVTELTAEERDKLLKLEERLHERVIGQDEAIRAVSEAVRLSRTGLQETGRPIAAFLFLGPTGVGKTELARSIAWVIFGDEEALIRIDMSEYMERHAVARLIGAPPGYVGYEEGGQLTERVRRRPYSVLLLDEIEKAHADVQNVLLQVFDDGRLTDGKGRVVDFSNTIIIATSNLGAELIQGNLRVDKDARMSYEGLKGRLMEVVHRHFRPEFVNRIDDIIVFHSLSAEEIAQIVELQLDRVKRTAKGQDIELSFDRSLVDHLAEVGFRPEFGARELKRRIRTEVESRVATAMLEGELSEGDSAVIAYDGENRQVQVSLHDPSEKTTTEGESNTQEENRSIG
ncbi:AAA family ATPase [Candidatus Bipolaricaulota bacterium]